MDNNNILAQNQIGLDALHTYSPASKIAQDPYFRTLGFIKTVAPHMINGFMLGANLMSNSELSESSRLQYSPKKKGQTDIEHRQAIIDSLNASKRWAILGGNINSANSISNKIESLERSQNKEVSQANEQLEMSVDRNDQEDIANSIRDVLRGDRERFAQNKSANESKVTLNNLYSSLKDKQEIDYSMNEVELKSVVDVYKENYMPDRRGQRILDVALSKAKTNRIKSEVNSSLSKPDFGQKKKRIELVKEISKQIDEASFFDRKELRELKTLRYKLKYSMR